ncbi:cytochrome c5 [Thiogranum longum]|uniref:Cytochrome c5 n=1 Tax=Thiogranum longum TaxID=1537524 RepID=A0A4R1HM74_9GAMM|nr:cytochrome c [Thiogranum longum]TCK18332.1 cytochrome c5 [Thiogranum longum]
MKTRLTKQLKTTVAAISIGASVLLPLPAAAFDFPEPGDFASGSKAWAENCARCHNIRPANELRDDQWLTTVFHMRVRAGLTGQEARDILTFLQTSNVALVQEPVRPDDAPASTLSGKEIYQQTCIACHGADGKGAFAGVPDFTDPQGRLSKSDEELLKNVQNGFQSPGSPMAMPPRGGNSALTGGDLQKVIKYLHSEFGS